MAFERFDVVVVPFPFTDRTTTKRRPALVLSDAGVFNRRAGHSVLAMITSARHSNWPLDADITDLDSAGLPAPSLVRMKLFTLADQLVIRQAGILAGPDQQTVSDRLGRLLGMEMS